MKVRAVKKVDKDSAILSDDTVVRWTGHNLMDAYHLAVESALLGNVDKDNPLYPFVNKSLKAMLNPERQDLGIASLNKLKDLAIETNEYLDSKASSDDEFIEYKIAKTLFPWQKDVLAGMTKKNTMLCGRRSGKSYLESALAILHCTIGFDTINGFAKPRSVLVMGLTIAKCADVFWQNILKYKEISNLNGKVDNGKYCISFENGSKIQLVGNASKAEREKLRGGDWSYIIIDEAQSQQSLAYLMTDILGPIAKGRNSTIILSGTGAITNKGYWKDITTGELAPEWRHFTATMKDNPTIPADALDSVLKENKWTPDDITYRREYLAENVIDLTRIVYPVYHTGLVPEDKIVDFAAIGIDYGYADSNALVGLVMTHDNKIYEVATEKWNKSDVTTIKEKAAKMYNDLIKKYKIFESNIICVADNSDQTISRELWANGLAITNAYKVDRIQQIFDLREALKRGDILVNDKALTDEMESYVWKYDEETKSVIYETDDDFYHPDCLAALRYAYYYLIHRKN